MAFLGIGKKKSAPPTYQFTPYSGARPIAPSYTKEAEKALYETILPRSQGVGVGYDPARRASAQALLESTIGRQREDDVRAAKGRVSASGLSGNLRAQEALTGRVERDAARSLADQTNALNIEDLTYAANERDVNTGRLQNFSNFQFGQGNKVADFDLGVYSGEEGLKRDAANDAMEAYQYDRNQSDEFLNSLIEGGAMAAGMYFGGPAGASVGSSAAQALVGRQPGTGIAPREYIGSNAGFRKGTNNRYLVR